MIWPPTCGDIWVYEIERGTGTRLSAAPEDESNPQWSPDGSRIAFWSALGERNLIRVRASADAEPAEEFPIDGFRPRLSDWSTGDVLFVERGGDIWAGTLADRSFEPFVETPFTEGGAVASADGRLVADESDETGRREVYVRSFPDSGKRWRVSTDGGRTPVWRRDVGEIYYVSGDERITAVTGQSRKAQCWRGSSGRCRRLFTMFSTADMQKAGRPSEPLHCRLPKSLPDILDTTCLRSYKPSAGRSGR